MARRSRARWSTTFGRWVSDYGVRRVVVDLSARGHAVTVKCVYHWLSGMGRPDIERATALSDISRGRVSVQDIAHHRAEAAGYEQTDPHR